MMKRPTREAHVGPNGPAAPRHIKERELHQPHLTQSAESNSTFFYRFSADMTYLHLVTLLAVLPPITNALTVEHHEGALFQEHGYIISGLSWAHITATISIEQMRDDLLRFTQLTNFFQSAQDAYLESPLNSSDKARLQALQLICERRLAQMVQIVTDLEADLGAPGKSDLVYRSVPQDDPEHDSLLTRTPRQIAVGIAAIGGAIIGAIAGSLFSAFQTNTLVDILEKRVQTISHQVDSNTIAILQNQADILAVNRTLHQYNEIIKQMVIKNSLYEHHLLNIYATLMLQEQERRYALAEQAIDQLLLGKLHKGLITPDGLNNAIRDLQQQALQLGLVVGIQRPLELYQLPSSFLYQPRNRTLHVLIHVPMYRDSHVLTLHRYISTPIFLPELGKFVEVTTAPTYLARSSDGTAIKTYTTSDLDACLNIGHTYFCKEHYLERPSQTNCLLQLYSGLKQEDLPYCNIKILPSVANLRQLSATTYFLADSEPTTITTSCFRQPSLGGITKLDPGTYMITVNPNCTTTSPYWVIHPTLQVEDVAVPSKVVKYDCDLGSLEPVVKPADLNALQQSLAQIGQPVSLDHMTQLLKFRHEIQEETQNYWLHHATMGTSSIFTALIVLVLVGLACLGVKRFRARSRPQRSSEGGPQQIPLLNVVQVPAPVAAADPPIAVAPNANADPIFRFGLPN